MFDKKKYEPIKKEPDDTVGTIYYNDEKQFYNDIETTDVFPYQPPLPRYRREPEPPII